MTGYAVVDVETSGFHPPRAEILEVAVVHVDPAGRVTGRWDSLVRPVGGVGATHVHGITHAMAAAAPRFADIGVELHQLLAGRVVVAHNLAFDAKFLVAQFAQIGIDSPEIHGGICTLRHAQGVLPGPSHKLADCCRFAGIALENAHNALGDALATARLLGYFVAKGYTWRATPVVSRVTVPGPRTAIGESFRSRAG